MAKPRIDPAAGQAALAALNAGSQERTDVATATRYLLQLVTEVAPGHSVELRVPPWGAIQCVEGQDHTRGTPPNVVEMDPQTWIAVATGMQTWSDAVNAGTISASGVRSDLSNLFPLAQW